MEEYEMNTQQSEMVLANELTILEAIKTIVRLSNGNEETILTEIDNLKTELKKGQRSNR